MIFFIISNNNADLFQVGSKIQPLAYSWRRTDIPYNVSFDYDN